MIVRQVESGDAPAIQAIYAPFVSATTVSFEEMAPDVTEIERRISAIVTQYTYLVAELDGQVVGYAYACENRTRAAYRTSIDVSVYVERRAQRRGIARGLFAHLLPAATSLGYHAAFAGIALPNDASVALHKAMGFDPVGVYREVGRKFNAWHDVGWWQRLL